MKITTSPFLFLLYALSASVLIAGTIPDVKPATLLDIRTPAAPDMPRINGPSLFGVRPNHPLLYAIPVSGKRPITYSVDGLPSGAILNGTTGLISGAIAQAGEYTLTLHARNDLGMASRPFTLAVGEQIALTPPMGWNSWNCWGGRIDQEKILRSAKGMVEAGLSQHGWTYINLDDGWQGQRGGPFNGIQGEPKRFADMKALSDEVHALGLKLGIYSTPWITSYDRHVGGSSEDPNGVWNPITNQNLIQGQYDKNLFPYIIGKYHFFANDARQWAAWGFDYLKFDWAPNQPAETKEMFDALRGSGRDIVLSLSNNANNSLFKIIDQIAPIANSWRIGGDIRDNWDSIKSHGFANDRWAPDSAPGHWNDPDMFEVGANGGGEPKKLTPDEQYTHVTQWCLLAAPLLLGCDLEHLDSFTIGLLSNDEVLAVDQDPLGKQAVELSQSNGAPKSEAENRVYAKLLKGGDYAVGLFNTSNLPAIVTVQWSYLGLSGSHAVRDLWRQKDLGAMANHYSVAIAPHGCEMIRVSPSP